MVGMFAVAALVIGALSIGYSFEQPMSTNSNPNGNGSLDAAPSSSTLNVTATVTATYSIDTRLCGDNCTIDVPWTSIYYLYQNFTSLAKNSAIVVLANVTSERTTSPDFILISQYNVTVIQQIAGFGHLQAGVELQVDQVGGTMGGVTMNLTGEPPLKVGGTYVLFLSAPGGIVFGTDTVVTSESRTVSNGTTTTFTKVVTSPTSYDSPNDPLAQYILPADNGGDALIVVGGPQGTFYLQNGRVYSLNNAYPGDDGWLPLKVSGVPLLQFIQEVQAAAGVNATASSGSTVQASNSSMASVFGASSSSSSSTSSSQGSPMLLSGLAVAALVVAIGVVLAVAITRRRAQTKKNNGPKTFPRGMAREELRGSLRRHISNAKLNEECSSAAEEFTLGGQ